MLQSASSQVLLSKSCVVTTTSSHCTVLYCFISHSIQFYSKSLCCYLLCNVAVGVYETESGIFRLISDGDLPSAVAASCAIPYIFQPVQGTLNIGIGAAVLHCLICLCLFHSLCLSVFYASVSVFQHCLSNLAQPTDYSVSYPLISMFSVSCNGISSR